MERSVHLPPKRWFGMLQTLAGLPDVQPMLSTKISDNDPYGVLPVSTDEMMFIVNATALGGIDELCDLVEIVDAQPIEVRDRYLAAASNLLQSTSHIVASAWLADVHKEVSMGGLQLQRWHNSRR